MTVCFDLDGTLGHFGGGYTLLREALGALWGDTPGTAELARCTGSTDWEIVDELHRNRFGTPLSEAFYGDFQDECLGRFERSFPAGARSHTAFSCPLGALHGLRARRLPVAVVSGNAPLLLEFKLARLGIPGEVPRIGSLPGLSRAQLLARMLSAEGPHAYVGDRPHDLQAAQATGIPFIGVGARVPGIHPMVGVDDPPEVLLQALDAAVSAPRNRR